MTQKLPLLFILIFLASWAVAGQEVNPILSIRILEKQNLQDLELQSPANSGVWNRITLTRGHLSVNGKAQTGAIWGSYDATIKIKTPNLTRIYLGQISISTEKGQHGTELVIINQVPLDDYTACVTAYESAYAVSQPEYLTALAVIIRAYALAHRHRHTTYDLCDLTHCQVYQGLPPHFDFWHQMAQAGKDYAFPPSTDLKSIYFHRCCGGLLESADQLWGGSPSPNRTGPDELNGEVLCKADSFYRWTSSADVQMILAALNAMIHLPNKAALKSFTTVEKTNSGRNKTFSAVLEMPDGTTMEIRENALRFESEFGRSYGWRVFPSDWFDIQQKGTVFNFSGRGFGHGVGLCQSGAIRLAKLGWSWQKILNFYFPQTH